MDCEGCGQAIELGKGKPYTCYDGTLAWVCDDCLEEEDWWENEEDDYELDADDDEYWSYGGEEV